MEVQNLNYKFQSTKERLSDLAYVISQPKTDAQNPNKNYEAGGENVIFTMITSMEKVFLENDEKLKYLETLQGENRRQKDNLINRIQPVLKIQKNKPRKDQKFEIILNYVYHYYLKFY